MAKVLYIEDDQINALIVRKFLENQHEVTVATNSSKAIHLLKNEHFDLILMDICLGDELEGTELMHCIKGIPGCNGKKIIAFTAHAMLDDELRYLKQGFDGYLAKPINRDILRMKVANYLSN